MPYIGFNPTNAGSFIEIDDFGSSFNGSTTAFTLQVGSVSITPNIQNLLIMIDGVVQQPTSAFNVSGSTITFTEAPASGADLYAILMGQSASVGGGTIGADELKVSGDGSNGQVLTSDGDGTFSWATAAEDYLTLAGGALTGAVTTNSTFDGVDIATRDAILTSTTTTAGNALPKAGGTMTGAVTGMTGLTGGTGDLVWDTTTLVVDSSANKVGIGTASPASKLHINGTADSVVRGTFTGQGITASDGWLVGYVGAEDYLKIINYEAGTDIKFYTTPSGGSATERMSIRREGNVGIGTDSAGTPLEIRQSAFGSDKGLRFNNPNGGETWDFSIGADSGNRFDISNYNVGTPVISMNNSGNVGIGVTDPGATCEIKSADQNLWLSSTSATGDPVLKFLQADTQRAYIQYAENSGDEFLQFVCQEDPSYMRFIPGGGAVALTIASGGNATFGGNLYVKGDELDINPSGTAYLRLSSRVADGSEGWYFKSTGTASSTTLTVGSRWGSDQDPHITFGSSKSVEFAGNVTVDRGADASTLSIDTSNSGAFVAVLQLRNSSKSAFNDGVKIGHGGGYTMFKDNQNNELMRITPHSDSAGDSTVAIYDTLTKGSGSFKIDHPLPSKKDTHYLVHSFTESPRADLIYRDKVTLVDGSATINIDTVAGMTEGTFVLLCDNVQCFTSNESNWKAVKGSVIGNILTIECEDSSSTAEIAWMVIGDRKDPKIMKANWTDENGKPIIEPEKENA